MFWNYCKLKKKASETRLARGRQPMHTTGNNEKQRTSVTKVRVQHRVMRFFPYLRSFRTNPIWVGSDSNAVQSRPGASSGSQYFYRDCRSHTRDVLNLVDTGETNVANLKYALAIKHFR